MVWCCHDTSHFESSPSSSDECRTAKWLPTLKPRFHSNASACVSCGFRLRNAHNASDCVWMETGLQTKPTDLSRESACIGCYCLHPHCDINTTLRYSRPKERWRRPQLACALFLATEPFWNRNFTISTKFSTCSSQTFVVMISFFSS